MAYKFIFKESDWEDAFSNQEKSELIPQFRACGYLDDVWYKERLEWAKSWHPDYRELQEYGSFKVVPSEKSDALEPYRKCDIAALLSSGDRLIHLQSQYVFEVEKGYDIALGNISNALGLGITHIECDKRGEVVYLQFVFQDRKYKVSFKDKEYHFPIPFLKGLLKIVERSNDWEFVYFDRNDNPSYTVIPSELARCLVQTGHIKKSRCMSFYFQLLISNLKSYVLPV